MLHIICSVVANVFCLLQVSENDGVWTIKTSTTLKTMELKFEIGKEFEETTPDGWFFTFVNFLIFLLFSAFKA